MGIGRRGCFDKVKDTCVDVTDIWVIKYVINAFLKRSPKPTFKLLIQSALALLRNFNNTLNPAHASGVFDNIRSF